MDVKPVIQAIVYARLPEGKGAGDGKEESNEI